MVAVWIVGALCVLTLLALIWRAVLRVAEEAKRSLESVDRAELALGGMELQVGRAKRHLSRMSKTRLRQVILRRIIRFDPTTPTQRSEQIASEA
ncbi:MAG: hypothetical protein NZ609_10880 [Acidimicrobiales bacterium]|nr:hypothetical protein [Acidimicrobiales bacterium]